MRQARETAPQQKRNPVRQPEYGSVQAKAVQAALQPAQGDSNRVTAADLLALQRTIGNYQVQRLITHRTDRENGDPITAGQAFTHGADVSFNEASYDPESSSSRRLPAHDLSHLVQQRGRHSTPEIQRETAQEIHGRFENWGGLNLQEEALAAYLVSLTRAGSYPLVTAVINDLSSSDRDDVAGEMMALLLAGGPPVLINMARNPDAIRMLRLMKDELGDWWGWTTEGEAHQVDLLGAVLNDPGARDAWNRTRIGTLKTEAGTDLEALARVFEDPQIIDDGTVSSRLQAVLGATAHLVIPGLQTGSSFGDTGFAGDQNPGGAGFRDPHPSSRNQVGHFMTAVGLQYSPAVVSRAIPIFGSIRNMVGAPAAMSDSDVALRLTIGHEKAPDPSGGLDIFVRIVATGAIEHLLPGPEGETEEQRDERVGRAIAAKTRRQIAEVIAAFRAQFNATTDADIVAWNEAVGALGTSNTLDMSAAETPLSRIAINPANRGNSIQDLRLSLVGWRLGQLIGNGAFADRAAVAAWIRTNLGAPAAP